ncbi:hypothetical protein GCM10027079_14720 [Sediminivirga luteola]
MFHGQRLRALLQARGWRAVSWMPMRTLRVTALVMLTAVSVSSCAHAVMVEPAADAADPDCAEVMLRLPDEVGGNERRDTTSQATAAWGDPSAAILRCGVEPPGPTTTPCVSVNGVDWLSEEAGDHWLFVTYGREPAVEVLVSNDAVGGQTVITELSGAVAVLEQERECVSVEDATVVDEEGQ